MERQQTECITEDLNRKLVFIVGPRQVGKTWLARRIARNFSHPVYLNHDSLEDRRIIQNEEWLQSTDLLILDEIHKMKGWKNFLKGVFDTRPDGMKILVTGSARLDTFRQSGDSMAGRFFTHRLLPFTPSELKQTEYSDNLDRFIERGGFPEPFLATSNRTANRWRTQYLDGLVRNDILDFSNVTSLKAIEMVLELLRHRVGSPISYSSIAGDVGIAPNTVKKYISILESLYIVFRVMPHSRNIARSIRKEPKFYFFDVGLVRGDNGAIFENLTALALLKHAYLQTDREGVLYEVRYLRTKEHREIDFCLVMENDILFALECKLKDPNISKHLLYLTEKYGIKGIQLVKDLKRERQIGNIEVRRALPFLKEL
ncbi:MAG: ATP-binding protein [Holophagae bacterium]|nr:ATP-binding protein [Holophagae bacterium]